MKKKAQLTGIKAETSPPWSAVITRFARIFIPLLVVLTLVLYFFYTIETRIKRHELEQRQHQLVDMQKLTINSHLHSVVSDLLLLSGGQNHQIIWTQGLDGTAKQRLLELYYSFISKRRVYDQVRLLDETGMEIVRVRYDHGQPMIVPPDQLQFKGHRYYFKETMKLGRNEIYVSPFDLNVENGQIEQPLKPVIRLATPVFDEAGRKRGIVVLCLLGNTILDELAHNAEAASGDLMLLNAEAFYLKGPNPDQEWGFMFDGKENQTFANDFKAAWSTIQAQEAGQFYTDDGLFTFQTIHPIQQGLFRSIEGIFTPQLAVDNYYWKYVSRVSPEALQGEVDYVQFQFALTFLIFSGGLGAVSWILARNSLLKEASEAKVRLLYHAVDASPAIAVIVDRQGRIQYVNSKFTEVTGYAAAEVIGVDGRKIIKRSPEEMQAIEHSINASGVWRGVSLNHKKNGEPYWELATVSPIRDEHNQFSHLVGIGLDITEHKKMEEELRQAKKTAEAASQAKSEFLANMSHEIRTPMNGVIGMTELALELSSSKRQHDYLGIALSSAETLLSLLNDILDFSKIEAGQLELETIGFNLWEAVEKTVDILVPRAVEKQLELALDIMPDVPVGVEGDPLRIRQVLINLIGNAIKFTEQGEVVVRVRKQAKAGDSVILLFTVTDTGIGIAADKQAKIFESFAQTDNAITRQFGGTGLGLTISQQLVRMMGGDIRVESQVGQGSTFSFTLSLTLTPNYNEPFDQNEIAPLQARRVMIIDDNVTNRHILQRTLDMFNCQVAEASNGLQGLEVLSQAAAAGQPFDLLLLDVDMQPMDGLRVLQIIRQRADLKHLPVIMLTSVDKLNRLDRDQSASWSDYLIKPIKQIDLLESILRVLNQGQVHLNPTTAQPTPAETRSLPTGFDILLVEDNEVNRHVGLEILKLGGHRVTMAENGRRALELLEENNRFDLILMDIQMPKMDGLEATRMIRQDSRWQQLPIIALTAHAMKGDRDRFITAGMNDYISKPARSKELLAAIERNVSAPNPVTEASEPKPEVDQPMVFNMAEASQPKPDVDQPLVFNYQELLAEMGGNEALVEELIAKLLQQIESQLPKIAASIAAGDMGQLGQEAHTLKGAAAMISAGRLRDAAYRLEMIGRKDTPAEALAALADLIAVQSEFQANIKTRWPQLSRELQAG